jgi:large subunit ribosomal protein L22
MASSTNALCRRLASLSLQKSPLRSLSSLLAVSSRPGLATTSPWRSFLTRRFSTAVEETAPTFTTPQLVHTDDGRQFAAFDMRLHPKLKPYIVKRRLNRMRLYVGQEKNIRHSPWRLNLVCQLAAGLPLQEALTQLQFCEKSKAPLVQKVLTRIANLADMRDGLQHSQLEVAECFATKGTPLKRVKTMGRGRSGKMERKHSHFRVILREIDFKLRIYQAPSINQKKKWFLLQQLAQRDGDRARAEREEVERLERETAAPKIS